ncbi:MAG: tetratricopeptide repeat protein [Chitinophagaceae bacterium]|nr:tetratricopeptide repeat protein [Chitinophagaceae bacterium]MCW5915519.1 tetratricopeptide repeat protein [Chitinophagaceae bacterium]MCZ2397570.1 tetratricopeptide repeat protein [Chitinophagales bacterium]
MRLSIACILLFFLTSGNFCLAQNKSRTDSLINLLNHNSSISVKEKQTLLEDIISELVEYDSVNAEKYLLIWKKEYYPHTTVAKTFYHKNRGILYLNFSNPHKALAEIDEGLAIAQRGKMELELADFYNNRANVKSETEDDKGALADYDEAIRIYQKIGRKKDAALSLSNKANLYGIKGNFKAAIPIALEALNIREALNDRGGIASTSFNLGIMFKNLEQYEDALRYLSSAEKIYLEQRNEKSLGTVYLVKGSVYRSQGKYDISKATFGKAIPIMEKYDFKAGLVNAYENMGTLAAIADSNEEEALSYYLKAEEIVSALHRNQGKISAGINVAQSYLNLKRYNEFNSKIESIEALARTYGYSSELKEILKLRMLYAMDRQQDAYGKEVLDEYEKLGDSINGVDIRNQINELQIKYETEKKEEQIKLLHSRNELQKQILAANQLALRNNELELDKKNLQLGNQDLKIKNQEALLANNELRIKNNEQEIEVLALSDKNKSLKIRERNRQLLFGAGGVVLLLALGLLYYNRQKIREKARFQEALLEEQDKAAKAVIGAEENERARMSQHLHDGLGQLLSAAKMNLQAAMDYLPDDPKLAKIYDNTLQLVDDSILEMRSVSHELVTNNVMRKGLVNALKELIEKISNNRLRVNLEVNGLLQHVNTDIQLVVYRVLQECIQNVIRHAEASRVDILLNVDKEYLSGVVRDNGKGFDTATTDGKKGIGLSNIEARIKFLKGRYKMVSTPGAGTSLDFEIPL